MQQQVGVRRSKTGENQSKQGKAQDEHGEGLSDHLGHNRWVHGCRGGSGATVHLACNRLSGLNSWLRTPACIVVSILAICMRGDHKTGWYPSGAAFLLTPPVVCMTGPCYGDLAENISGRGRGRAIIQLGDQSV